MTSKRCEGTNKDGSRCKRMTHRGDYCEIHQRHIDEEKRQERELEESTTLKLSARNMAKIDYLLMRPEFDFKNEDMLVGWLIEKARMSEPTLRLMLDVFEQQVRV